MKCPAFFLGLLVCSAAASAQQTAMVQMQCRDLASTGNFVNSDEGRRAMQRRARVIGTQDDTDIDFNWRHSTLTIEEIEGAA